MPTVLSSPFACSALTPPNRVKKKKKKGKKEGRNDTQRGKETGIGDYISGFVRLKVTRFQRKVELSYPFDTHARTRAHAHAPARNRSKIVHISCNNGNRTFFSLSLFLSFVCFKRGENFRFHAFIIPENWRRVHSARTFEPRIFSPSRRDCIARRMQKRMAPFPVKARGWKGR